MDAESERQFREFVAARSLALRRIRFRADPDPAERVERRPEREVAEILGC